MKLLNKLSNNSVNFAKISEEWLTFKKNSVKESTFFRYKYILETYLSEELQGKKLLELKQYDFNKHIENLSNRLSKKTVLSVITILKSILSFGERKYNCDFKLDLIASYTVTVGENEIEILKNSEFTKLEKYCLEHLNYRNLGILLCLYTGIRLGELCALKWENINLQSRQISITKTMQRICIKGKKSFISIDAPKSKKSVRTIPITNKIITVLRDVKTENKFNGNAYFLTGCENSYIEPRNLEYHFDKVLKKCGIKDYNFHVLRHSFATRCIQIGMDIKSLSEILGHSSVTITLNRYVHSSLKIKTKFINKL